MLLRDEELRKPRNVAARWVQTPIFFLPRVAAAGVRGGGAARWVQTPILLLPHVAAAGVRRGGLPELPVAGGLREGG